ncbi:hypothetical protein LOK49_LG14G00416 [Camellia lanceoleosa]|uniref:Uncharacterized protein n=1 Tax=Camellia lanceoleosa TaxID=1840588 RepID=A0ACC0F8A5_9ERIC|nr:hypothetical protein LOK49_LG14G00416 [Camellia lanceoleosa]
MIKAGGVLKMIEEERVMMESLMCLQRAGADIILAYFALQAARCLCDPQERLKNLLRHSGNGFCADCGSPNPKWV